MAASTNKKRTSAKPSVKSSATKNVVQYQADRAARAATKHGHGLDHEHVAGITDREFREHKASLEYSKIHLIAVALGTALVVMVSMYLTSRWYGL